MSDFDPGQLPIRSQIPGQLNYEDVLIRLADATNPAQVAAVDSFGSQFSVLKDGAGNLIGDQLLSASYWLQSVSPSNGSAAGGAAASFSNLSGGLYLTALPTLTNGQQSAIHLDSSGRVLVSVGNLPTTVDTNYGAVGSSTIRSAAQLGNATGAADFNNGATGAQTLRVAANLAVGGANVSGTNPVPVSLTSTLVGTSINNYNTGSAVPAGSTSDHVYVITSGKIFQGKKIWASASGALKIEVQVSPDGSTYSTLWVGFNSAADPNIPIDLDQLVFLESGVGSTIKIIRTNQDKKPMDVYSTISGTEV